MLELGLAVIFVKAFMLCGLLYVFGRHEADYNFQKVAMVTAAIVLGGLVIQLLLEPTIGAFTIIPILVFTGFMLVQFCWIRVSRAIIVVLILAAIDMGIHTAARLFDRKLHEAALTQGPADESDYQVVADMMQDLSCGNQYERATPPVESPSTPPAAPAATTPVPAHAPEIAARPAPPLPLDWQAAQKTLIFGGTMSGPNGTRFAMLNGRPVAVGEYISTTYQGKRYEWRVTAVSTRAYELEPMLP